MAITDQLPDEGTLQYYLRQGLSPNQASALLVGGSTGNVGAAPKEQLTRLERNSRTKVPEFGWFGGKMVGGEGLNLQPSTATEGWVGQNWAKYPTSAGGAATPTGSAAPGGIINAGGTSAAPGAAQPGTTPTGATSPSGSTTFPSGGSGGGTTPDNGGLTYGGTGPSTLPPGSTQQTPLAPPNGTIPVGEGMWSGNRTPDIGTPGQPGYIPGHAIQPNIVQTTQFANPNPAYASQQAPLSGLATPTNPATMPQVDPVTGQVVQSGADAGTVQGQLSNILKDGNPLLEAARTRAAQAANARGLINSSMAAQAGEEAMVNAALPIAQQDASTFENRALVNQNISNQFLSMREGARLNLQAAYEAFKQNNYGFDKNAALQTYLNDSGISSQQKIAALQAAVSQANTATQVQGELERTGMSLAAQQWLQTNVPSTALMQIGATNLANYASGLANIMSSQLEPADKSTAVANWNAVWAGQNLGGLVINGVQTLPLDTNAGSPVPTSPTASVPTDDGSRTGG